LNHEDEKNTKKIKNYLAAEDALRESSRAGEQVSRRKRKMAAEGAENAEGK